MIIYTEAILNTVYIMMQVYSPLQLGIHSSVVFGLEYFCDKFTGHMVLAEI